MARIDNDTINKIKDSLDIVDVISNYVSLTSRGKNYFGVCPFHDDTNPSMSVSKEKQIYTCFSCGASGNVIKFIMDYENISFPEALKKCANMANIHIDINDRAPTHALPDTAPDIDAFKPLRFGKKIHRLHTQSL